MRAVLFRLAWLQVKGWFRRQFAGGSARRTVFGVLATVMFLMWMLGGVVGALTQRARPEAEVLAILPIYITVFALLPIVFGSDDRAIAFSPAEVDFLFPGPFRRRDLVLFKLVKLSAGSLLGGLIFANVLHRFAGSFGSAVVGGMLALIFINLWATLIALVRDLARERFYTVFRRVTTAALLLAGAGVVWLVQTSAAPTLEEIERLAGSTPGRIVLAPARVFAHVFAARAPGEFWSWTLACLGMIGGAVALVLALDKGYMEAALAASQRRQARLAGMARGIVLPANKPVRSVALPELAALGPARAIVKKQMISALRTSRGWIVAIIVAAGYGYFMSRMGAHDEHMPRLVGMMPAVVIMLMFLPQALRFDFRTDLDHLDLLKALPLPARAVAAAELAVPSAMLSLVGVVIVAGMAVFADTPARSVAMGALAIVPLSVCVIGLENFVFLLMPTRLFSQGQASMVLSGRRMVMVLARLGLLVIGGGLVFAAGGGAWSITHSAWAAFIAGWGAAAVIAAGVVLGVAWAFARFDVSADMPV